MKRTSLVITVLFLFLTVFSLSVLGQPDPAGGPGDNDPSTPFDGGILLVILGAIGFGIKKIKSGINKI